MFPIALILLSLCGAQANVIMSPQNATTVRGTFDKTSLNVERIWAAIKQLQQRVSALEYKPTPPSIFDLRFPSADVTNYAIHSGLPSMRALTACLWVKSDDPTNDAALLSYAVSSRYSSTPRDNDLLIENSEGMLTIWIRNYYIRTNVATSDGKWHHICLTWENSAGSWILYKDGQAEANGTSMRAGHVIGPGGALVIGQEQDNVGGDFDGFQSFVGDLTGYNIWSKVLDPSEISQMSVDCTAGEGDVFKWRDVLKGIHGNVQVIQPSTCGADVAGV